MKANIGNEDLQLECLVYVVQNNNFELLRYLITEVKLDKDILQRATNNQQGKQGRTIVHIAAELGHDLMLYFFGEMGLDIDATDSNGDTPLHLAV